MKSARGWTSWLATPVIAMTLVLAGCTPATTGPPSATGPTQTTSTTSTKPAAITATVVAARGTPLRLRSKPTTTASVLATLKRGTNVTLTCQTTGPTITGPEGTTNVWHQTTYKKKKGYLSAAYLRMNGDTAVPACPDASPQTTLRRGPEMDAKIIEIARGQLGVKETKGNCNPYGPCVPWCALYATWVWRKAGDTIPKFAFTGDLYTWGKRDNRSHDTLAGVGPGDLVLYGTGPKSAKTSVHVDIVIEVFEDHLRVIGGNVKNKVTERDVPKKGIYAWVDA